MQRHPGSTGNSENYDREHMMPPPPVKYDSWWTIHGQALIDALRRAHTGDDPEIVYAELYANSDHEGASR